MGFHDLSFGSQDPVNVIHGIAATSVVIDRVIDACFLAISFLVP